MRYNKHVTKKTFDFQSQEVDIHSHIPTDSHSSHSSHSDASDASVTRTWE